MAETEAHGNGERKVDEPYGTTPLLRFLGDYLKKVEKAGNKLVPCNDEKYSAFATAVNYRPPSLTRLSETEKLLANMRAAGMLSTADAEGSDPTDDGDDGNISAATPRRRFTRAEYDAGYGNSSDGWSGDDAHRSDDEAQIDNSADRAPPSLAGSAVSG